MKFSPYIMSWVFFAFLILAGIIFVLLFSRETKIPNQKVSISSDEFVTKEDIPPLPEEMQQLLATTNQAERVEKVHTMAEKYGTLETLSYMRRSGLPFTGDTHLLVHEIGDVAYKKYGHQALLHCDESFLAACYHGVVLNALADNGMTGVSTLVEQCKAAGPSVLAQCSHAAGHGFLAWQEYKVLNALPYCDKLAVQDAAIPAFNCYDGVFMENIFGVHEGKPSPNRMIDHSDPYYPCNAVPGKYQEGCYANQATVMYEIFGGDLKKVAEGCDSVTNPNLQKICYNNFARQIHPLTLGQTDKAVLFCQNATGIYWQDDCIISLVTAAFSVGDTQAMPYELCETLSGHARADECYRAIYNNIDWQAKDQSEKSSWCELIRDSARQLECQARFTSQ